MPGKRQPRPGKQGQDGYEHVPCPRSEQRQRRRRHAGKGEVQRHLDPTRKNRRGQNKEYVVSLEQKLEAAGSIERRKEILREIARVYDEQMGNPEDAENALVRALELEPDLDTLGVLVTLQRRQNNHPAVASTLMRMRDIAPTPEDRARIQVEVVATSPSTS